MLALTADPYLEQDDPVELATIFWKFQAVMIQTGCTKGGPNSHYEAMEYNSGMLMREDSCKVRSSLTESAALLDIPLLLLSGSWLTAGDGSTLAFAAAASNPRSDRRF